MRPASTTAAVELRELTKRFGDVPANAGVNLRVEPGSIHAIIGENGAGKSTAMKLLYGIYHPDSGEIFVDGKPRLWRSPSDAIACGLGMVHQHFMLAGPHTALDNILLGAEPVRWGWLNRPAALKKLESLASQYGLLVDWRCPVEELSVGVQQRVEILKLLYRDARVLILDEPTGVLTPQETNNLFRNLRQMRDEGKTILLVTHKLKEVMALADRVTVFRAGRVAGEALTSETDAQGLANLMVGRKVALKQEAPTAQSRGGSAVEAEGLGLAGASGNRRKLADVSLNVQCGEIVGLAGVEGNGQAELLQALLHPAEPACRTTGCVKILGLDVTTWDASRIRQLGVAVIPEDRQKEGLLAERPLRENFLLGLQRQPDFNSAGFLKFNNLSEAVAVSIKDYDIRPAKLDLHAGKLSGGNQQKLIIAREFHRKPKVLIAAQPTRGVDVGAIEFIHRRILRARDEGVGILLISSDLDEVLALSDRILVIYEGRIAGEFSRGQVSEMELGLKMGGS